MDAKAKAPKAVAGKRVVENGWWKTGGGKRAAAERVVATENAWRLQARGDGERGA